jgi:sugar lactone lactonase YvrE
MDRSGDLFIADTGNCRVREVPARTGHSFGVPVHAGDIVTIAGGPCTGSKPNPAPAALALDPAGDLFIASSTGARVEELPATTGTQFGIPVTAGRLVTIAGTGVSGYGGDGGPAPHSVLDDPSGLAVDPTGDLLIADTANCRLRLVAASSGTRFGVSVVAGHIYTVAGSGICGSDGGSGPALAAQLWDPGAVAVDSGGNVLFADQGSRSIRLLAATTGRYYGVTVVADHLGTVAGEGSYGPYLVDGLSAVGETAELNFPTALAVDGHGNLSIADGAMHAIRMVPAVTTTLLGKKVTADNLYTAAGAMGTGGLRDGTSWIQTRLLQPAGLTLSTDGALIYSDSQANVVRQLPVGR